MCTLIQYLGFMGFYVCSFFSCLVGCFSMTVWTPAVLSVLYACILYFCICPGSAQLSMFHMEKCCRNKLIINITVISVCVDMTCLQTYKVHTATCLCPYLGCWTTPCLGWLSGCWGTATWSQQARWRWPWWRRVALCVSSSSSLCYEGSSALQGPQYCAGSFRATVLSDVFFFFIQWVLSAWIWARVTWMWLPFNFVWQPQ